MRHVEKTISISDLVHDDTNPRNHDSIANRRSVQSSLRAHGQVVPILVQAGTNKIIHGNLRVETMREMGIKEAACWIIEADDIESKRLAITLNKSGELASWNEDVLAGQLKDLTDTLPDFDLEDLGFDSSILDSIVEEDPFGGEEVNEDYFSDDQDAFGDEFDEAVSVDDEFKDDVPAAPSAPSKPESVVIQLFIKPEEQERFTSSIQSLADHWGLTSTSEVIMMAIDECHEINRV